MVAQEGVPACLLLGHADGSICSVQLPGGAPPETMLGQHGAPVTALLALRTTAAAADRHELVRVRVRRALTPTLTLTAAAADRHERRAHFVSLYLPLSPSVSLYLPRSPARHERRAHFVSAAADGTVLVWRLREPRPIARP